MEKLKFNYKFPVHFHQNKGEFVQLKWNSEIKSIPKILREKLSQICQDPFESQVFEQCLEKRSSPGSRELQTEESWKSWIFLQLTARGTVDFGILSPDHSLQSKTNFSPDHSLQSKAHFSPDHSLFPQKAETSWAPSLGKAGENPFKIRVNTQKHGQKNSRISDFLS